MWTMTKSSGSTPVRRPSAVNADENSYKSHMLWNHSYWPHFYRWQLRPTVIQSRMVSSESHNIRTSSVPPVKRTIRWIGHSRSFTVIIIGAGRLQRMARWRTYKLWLSELTMRDWMNMDLKCQRQKVWPMNCSFLSKRGFYEFLRGFSA